MESADTTLEQVAASPPSSSSSSTNWKERILYPTILAGMTEIDILARMTTKRKRLTVKGASDVAPTNAPSGAAPGFVGGGVGLVSKHRKLHGLANISATYAANFTIVTGFYCGAREFVRVSRRAGPDDLISSAVAGFGSGAILGRLQGGRIGAVRYSIGFAVVGTTADFAIIKVMQRFSEIRFSGDSSISEKVGSWLRMPEWSPIRILDEEALAAKRAQEQQLQARIRELRKGES